MTFDERVHALERLHLTPRQARFVVTVALHSGYCLRRQYMAFAGLRYGKVVRHFLDHLVSRRLAVRETCRADRGFLYHLYARSIYRVLRQEDNRNRRRASLAAIGRKLMLLDFVIANGTGEWYATQDDKVELFTRRFGVPLTDLPQQTYAAYDQRVAPTTRYFAQKLPIRMTGDNEPVEFVTLALEPTGQAFARFLHDHARLLSHLPRWTIIVVTPAGGTGASACHTAFDRYAGGLQSVLPFDRAELVRYFAMRRSIEANDLSGLSVPDLNWFRESRQRLAETAIESLYARWLAVGDQAFEERMTAQASAALSVGRFVTYKLPFAYQQFGDLAGVC